MLTDRPSTTVNTENSFVDIKYANSSTSVMQYKKGIPRHFEVDFKQLRTGKIKEQSEEK